MKETILSTGIDIGTSTTQLIFSRLTIENLASSYSVPRISIVDKEVIYRSRIYFTPLKSQTEIDAQKVRQIVQDEYRAAGLTAQDLQTGAVIITGETARKENANEVLASLSEMAGDFVVATAGPDLESVLSAKGAGADIQAKENALVLANIDIGGGTSNIAVFNKSNLAATTCLDIGGRLIKIRDGKITYIFKKIKDLCARNRISIQEGDRADVSVLRKICDLMADELAASLNLTERKEYHDQLYTNDEKPLGEKTVVEAVMYSGGVADCVYNTETADVFKYGDIGILLGEAIRNNKALNSVRQCRAAETIRATVVGAGMHTTDVSGSTISYVQDKLPIKNIPVIKISEEDPSVDALAEIMKSRIHMYYKNESRDYLAISMDGSAFSSFTDIQDLADAFIKGARDIIESEFPLIIVLEKDIAKALGNSLRMKLGKDAAVICIDSIHTNDGDYIDIGEPLSNGSVVPVITKTLIFNS